MAIFRVPFARGGAPGAEAPRLPEEYISAKVESLRGNFVLPVFVARGFFFSWGVVAIFRDLLLRRGAPGAGAPRLPSEYMSAEVGSLRGNFALPVFVVRGAFLSW